MAALALPYCSILCRKTSLTIGPQIFFGDSTAPKSHLPFLFCAILTFIPECNRMPESHCSYSLLFFLPLSFKISLKIVLYKSLCKNLQTVFSLLFRSMQSMQMLVLKKKINEETVNKQFMQF